MDDGDEIPTPNKDGVSTDSYVHLDIADDFIAALDQAVDDLKSNVKVGSGEIDSRVGALMRKHSFAFSDVQDGIFRIGIQNDEVGISQSFPADLAMDWFYSDLAPPLEDEETIAAARVVLAWLVKHAAILRDALTLLSPDEQAQ